LVNTHGEKEASATYWCCWKFVCLKAMPKATAEACKELNNSPQIPTAESTGKESLKTKVGE